MQSVPRRPRLNASGERAGRESEALAGVRELLEQARRQCRQPLRIFTFPHEAQRFAPRPTSTPQSTHGLRAQYLPCSIRISRYHVLPLLVKGLRRGADVCGCRAIHVRRLAPFSNTRRTCHGPPCRVASAGVVSSTRFIFGKEPAAKSKAKLDTAWSTATASRCGSLMALRGRRRQRLDAEGDQSFHALRAREHGPQGVLWHYFAKRRLGRLVERPNGIRPLSALMLSRCAAADLPAAVHRRGCLALRLSAAPAMSPPASGEVSGMASAELQSRLRLVRIPSRFHRASILETGQPSPQTPIRKTLGHTGTAALDARRRLRLVRPLEPAARSAARRWLGTAGRC